MLSILSDTTLRCVELFLSLFLTRLSLLNDRSAVATVTGNVRKIRKATQTFENSSLSLSFENPFNKVAGVTNSPVG